MYGARWSEVEESWRLCGGAARCAAARAGSKSGMNDGREGGGIGMTDKVEGSGLRGSGRAVAAGGFGGILYRCALGPAIFSVGAAGCSFDWTREPRPADRASKTVTAPDVPAADDTASNSNSAGTPTLPTKDGGGVPDCSATKGCSAGQYCELSQGCGGSGMCVSVRACLGGKSSCGCDGRVANDCSTEAAGGSIDATGAACLAGSCKICDPATQECSPPSSSSPTTCLCKSSTGPITIACK